METLLMRNEELEGRLVSMADKCNALTSMVQYYESLVNELKAKTLSTLPMD